MKIPHIIKIIKEIGFWYGAYSLVTEIASKAADAIVNNLPSTFKSISFKLDGSSVIAKVDIEIINKNGFAIKIDSFRGLLYFGNAEISRLGLFKEISIQSKEVKTIPIYFKITSEIFNELQKVKGKERFRVMGQLVSNKAIINIDYSPCLLV